MLMHKFSKEKFQGQEDDGVLFVIEHVIRGAGGWDAEGFKVPCEGGNGSVRARVCIEYGNSVLYKVNPMLPVVG